jgi:tripartite-type tricarboxylate transporter receptor subunit TctC
VRIRFLPVDPSVILGHILEGSDLRPASEKRMACRRPSAFLSALTLALAFMAPASAAEWPSHPLRLVVPYAPGGGTDLVARMIGPKLAEALKQPVIVENKVGANGAIAVDFVVRAPADGYTVLFDSMSIVITPLIAAVPYDLARDLQPVAKVLSQAFVIVSTPKLPVKSLRELVKYSNERPNGLNVAVPGAATRLAGELFKLTTNARMTFIPYKGGGPAALAVIGGETDLAFMDVPSVAQNVIGGRLNALAVSTDSRVKLLPEVPTTTEAGMPEYKVDSWIGTFVAAGTPPDIVARLNTEINAALAASDVVARISQLGGEPSRSTVGGFNQLYRAEIERWKDVVVRAKVKVE